MIRPITINPILNGYVCKVGCQTVCFTDKRSLLNALSDYLEKPCETEQRFLNSAVNSPENCPSLPGQCDAQRPPVNDGIGYGVETIVHRPA